jgi:hypothetical protein
MNTGIIERMRAKSKEIAVKKPELVPLHALLGIKPTQAMTAGHHYIEAHERLKGEPPPLVEVQNLPHYGKTVTRKVRGYDPRDKDALVKLVCKKVMRERNRNPTHTP